VEEPLPHVHHYVAVLAGPRHTVYVLPMVGSLLSKKSRSYVASVSCKNNSLLVPFFIVTVP
jgi:hypothetical protein